MLSRAFARVAGICCIPVIWLALVGSAVAEESRENVFSIGLGQTLFNGDMTAAEVSIRHQRWELGGVILGQGDTSEGAQERLGYAASITRMLRPGWEWCRGSVYGRVGLAYVDGSPLVGHFNFRTGVGIDFRGFSLEYQHLSSASLTRLNTGIDVIQFRIPF
ncbi:hypothetical protein AUP74_00077 [Microbulbifer aggregans]|uniref:Lipid A 3-O-deacylase (PagL) n=1 Tax=Microbulbifer aggregans TaxID=1769779 RepID=A0A1C9W346_9GAMM|nr:hypothetical protein AUP74_00077 [Microbulbifer aggregans]